MQSALARSLWIVCLAAMWPLAAPGQTMSVEEYEPKSTLVVPEHHPAAAKYPFIPQRESFRSPALAKLGRVADS